MISENEKLQEIKEYFYTNESGDAQITVYGVFPGVEIAYVSVHMMDFDFGLIEQDFCKNYVRIHYCKEGRIEQEIGNEFFYLMQGDCSIVIQDKCQKRFQVPLKLITGIPYTLRKEFCKYVTEIPNSIVSFFMVIFSLIFCEI